MVLAVEVFDVHHLLHGGVDIGFLIRNGTVGEIVFTKRGAQRNIRCDKVSRRHGVWVDGAGAGIERVGQRRSRGREQWSVARRQGRAPRQRGLGLLGRGDGQRGHRVQLPA